MKFCMSLHVLLRAGWVYSWTSLEQLSLVVHTPGQGADLLCAAAWPVTAVVSQQVLNCSWLREKGCMECDPI